MASRRRGAVQELAPGRWKVRADLGTNALGKRERVVRHVQGTKKDAEAELTRLLREQDEGRLAKPKKDTVAEFLERWLAEAAKPRIAVATAGMYRRFLDKHVLPQVGRIPLAKLTALDVQALYNALTAKGLGPAIIRRIHGMLHSALEQAVWWSMIPRNPSDRVALPKLKKPEIHAMSADEAVRFLDSATLDRHSALWAFLLETGARPGEALAIRWKDVDLTAKSATIRRSLAWTAEGVYVFGDTKTGKVRMIPVSVELAADLKRHKAKQAAERLAAGADWVEEDLVFPTELGTPHRDENLATRHYRPILVRAGLATAKKREKSATGKWRAPRIETVFRVYDLRHTCATLLLAAGQNVKVVSERLGHASVQVTLDHYAHVLPGMQDQATEKLGAILYKRSESGS